MKFFRVNENKRPNGRRISVIPELTAKDRCDYSDCHAQARAVVDFGNQSMLMFCRHHTEAHRIKLKMQGAIIHTQYEGL